jgi:hypothetical protein
MPSGITVVYRLCPHGRSGIAAVSTGWWCTGFAHCLNTASEAKGVDRAKEKWVRGETLAGCMVILCSSGSGKNSCRAQQDLQFSDGVLSGEAGPVGP